MFTAESIKLLAKDARRRTGRTQLHSLDKDDGRDGVKVGEGEPSDPDDVIDPDDLIGTAPVQCALLLPPPVKPETWWTALVLGSENDAVAPQDASLALAHVACRLGYARAVMGNPHIGLGTVGQLQEMLEALYGEAGWKALVECWHAAAGITRPTRVHASITNKIPEGELPQPQIPACSLAREAEALRSLPGAVRRFWLYEPRDPPPWRQKESESERLQREALESLGGWTG
jgi:hypothetical protein